MLARAQVSGSGQASEFGYPGPSAKLVRPLPVPAVPEFTALPVGPQEDGDGYPLRLFGTQVLVVGGPHHRPGPGCAGRGSHPAGPASGGDRPSRPSSPVAGRLACCP
ncbi:hypothetical protein DLE60_16620 [Micromonospora globispora]|nr:hypothetical protein DLE60_16620 [Micromonospora globispora]